MVLRKWNARIPTLPSSASIEGKHHDYTKTLHHPRLKHPFPLSQGPIILPLDTNLEPSNSFGQGVEEKTVFSHNETQACAMYLTLPYSAIAKVSSAWNVRDNWLRGDWVRTCEVCMKECKDKNDKEKHIVAIHSQQAQKYACCVCPKSYSSLSSLSYHVKKHSDQTTKHACDQCGKHLATEASLARHRLTIHKAEREMRERTLIL